MALGTRMAAPNHLAIRSRDRLSGGRRSDVADPRPAADTQPSTGSLAAASAPVFRVATRAPAEDAAASSDAMRLRVSRTAGDPPRFPLADLQTRRDLGSSP